MGLTKFTEKLISDSFKTSISGSDNAESASVSTRLTTAESELGNTLVSSSVLSSPSQGTIRLATNGVNTDVDSGLQAGDSPTFAGGTITGNFTVGGTLTAQEVHTEFESASIIFTSGSTIFGNSSDDVHNMTGSLNVSGSLFVKDGTLTVTDNVDFNGDLDVDGTTNLDVVDIDGAVDMASTLNVGGHLSASANISIIKSNAMLRLEESGGSKAYLFSGGAFTALRTVSNTPLQFGANYSSADTFFIGQNATTSSLQFKIGPIADNGDALITDGVDGGLYSVLTVKENGNTRFNLDFEGNGATNDLTLNSNSTNNILKIQPDGDVGIGTDSPSGHVHTYSDERYMLYLESTYGTDRKYWFRNDGGTLQLGEGAQGDSQVGFTFDTANKEFGIGTRSPDGVLDCHYSGTSVFKVQSDGVAVGNVNPGTYAQFHVRGAGDTSVTGSTFYDGYGDDNLAGNPASHTMCLQSTTTATRYMGPSLIFRTKVGTTLNTATVAGIVGSLDETPGSGVEAKGALRFFTSREYNYGPEFGTKMQEAMYIDYAGRVGIGTNNLGANLHVRTPFAGSVASVKIDGDNGTNDAGGMLTLAYNTTAKWNILSRNQTSVGSAFSLQIQDADGNDGVYMNQNATSFTSNSDERMKENIVELESATDKLNTLRCVNFTMKHDSSGEKRIGLIAQDVYKVYPEVTTGSPDVEYSYNSATTGSSHINAMGLQYTELVAPMIKAIQELSSQIGVLKAQISGSSDFNSLKTSVSGSN